MRGDADHLLGTEMAAELDQLEHLAGLAAGRERHDAIAVGDQPEIAVRRLAGMDEHRRGAGRGQGGGEFVRNVARLAHAGGDELLASCTGKIGATGMGKAGYIAHKFSATLSSTGTPAVFVHPGEAAHGDLGLIANGDCIVAFSTSGKTREVLELIEFSRHLGSEKVIGVTSHPESELRPLCDVVLDMGEIVEPCPLGLTPTA